MRQGNYQFTDVDELARLKDQQSQRLAKENKWHDVWDSHQPLDLIARMGLLTSGSIAFWSLWQLTGWNPSIGVFLFLTKVCIGAYFAYRYGADKQKVFGFLSCLMIGLVFGIDFSGVVQWLL